MNCERRLLLAGLATLSMPSIAQSETIGTPRIGIVELRQYTLKKARRDELIRLFEREFVAPLNAAGAYVLGTYRDLDDPDRFVWLRGFETMETRVKSLASFYDGPVWRAQRSVANDTMIDSDNVLLLRADGGSNDWAKARPGGKQGIVTASIYYLGDVPAGTFRAFYASSLEPQLARLGAKPFGTLVSENAANSFPRLPVRQGEAVFVQLCAWRDEHEADAFQARLATLSGWRDNAPEPVLAAFMWKSEQLRLSPT